YVVLLLCSIYIRPPGSTLFRYTTLFRSLLGAEGERLRHGPQHSAPGRRHGKPPVSVCLPGVIFSHLAARPPAQTGARSCCRCTVDRKSTRLNSSHVKISYAVFCLKKKNL